MTTDVRHLDPLELVHACLTKIRRAKVVRLTLAGATAAGLVLLPTAAASAATSTTGQIEVQYGTDADGQPVAVVTVHDLNGTCPSTADAQPACADWLGLKIDNGDGTFSTVGGTWVGAGTASGDASAMVPLPDGAYRFFGIYESYVLHNPAPDNKIDWHLDFGASSDGTANIGGGIAGSIDISQADTNEQDINTGSYVVSDAGSGYHYVGHALRTDDTMVNVGDGQVVLTGTY